MRARSAAAPWSDASTTREGNSLYQRGVHRHGRVRNGHGRRRGDGRVPRRHRSSASSCRTSCIAIAPSGRCTVLPHLEVGPNVLESWRQWPHYASSIWQMATHRMPGLGARSQRAGRTDRRSHAGEHSVRALCARIGARDRQICTPLGLTIKDLVRRLRPRVRRRSQEREVALRPTCRSARRDQMARCNSRTFADRLVPR
jgi:hypothetical protein